VGAFQRDDCEIRPLPDLDRTDLRFDVPTRGAWIRREVEDGLRRHHAGVPSGRLVATARRPSCPRRHPSHCSRSASRSEADDDACVDHLRHGRDAATRELHVGDGAMSDARAATGERADLVHRDPDAMRRGDPVPEESDFSRATPRVEGLSSCDGLPPPARLGEVRVESDIASLGDFLRLRVGFPPRRRRLPARRRRA